MPPQHYEYPNRYHKSEKEFKEQHERDMAKMRICREG